VAPLANAVLGNRALRWLIERAMGIDRRAPLPRFAGRTFRSWARRNAPRDGARRVTYFHACGTNYYEPELGRRAVEVLAHNGFAVDVPRQDCCGLPLQSNGLFPQARTYVRRLERRLAPAARAGQPIVSTNPSCSLMLKREAREILAMEDDATLRMVGEHTFDISEFLLGLHDQGELRSDFRPMPLTVAYHAPCQQQGHGIGKPALDLMALVPELRVVELDALCCGMAGTYGLKKEKYEIAMKVGSDLFGQIDAAQPDLVVCDTDTCRWQIEHATGAEVVHPVTLLHRAYGLD
jgi:glycerol-3-phosphate dehydrogenase subunit C